MAETTFPNLIVFFGILLLRQLITLENPLGIFTFPPGISLNIPVSSKDMFTSVTCSLGYLKLHHNKLFKPPLPQNKMDAIENMGFGKVNKIFLYFEKPYWTKGKGGVKLAWNHTSNSFEESQWYKSIFAFDEVLNNPKVLVAWVHGKAAEYMETLPENTKEIFC
jgi:hypothetical protein